MEAYLNEFEAYLADTDHAPLTIMGYLGDVRLFLNWYIPEFGEPPSLAVFTETVIAAYKTSMAAFHPGTVYRRLAALAAFFHWGRQAGYLYVPYNPVNPVKAIRYAPPVIHWLTPAAQTQFLAGLARLTAEAALLTPHYQYLALRDLAMVKLLLATGLKPVEVVALTLDEVDLHPEQEALRLAPSPPLPGRAFALPSYCHQGLRAYLTQRPALPTARFFLGPRGETVNEKTVRRALLRFAQEPDLPEVSAQSLRHTYVKNLLDQGVAPEEISTRLGHPTLAYTQRYLPLFENPPKKETAA